MWSTATDYGAEDDVSAILLSGLSNVYTDYITTYEEYQQQGLDSMENIIMRFDMILRFHAKQTKIGNEDMS